MNEWNKVVIAATNIYYGSFQIVKLCCCSPFSSSSPPPLNPPALLGDSIDHAPVDASDFIMHVLHLMLAQLLLSRGVHNAYCTWHIYIHVYLHAAP